MITASDTSTTCRQGRRATIARVVLLTIAACLLIGCQALMAALSPGWTQPSFKTLGDMVPVVGLLALPAFVGLAVAGVLERTRVTSAATLALIAVGVAMRAVWLGVPVAIDDDYYRYLWDGAVLVSGNNPYAIAPKVFLEGSASLPPELANLAARGLQILRGINFPELTTMYPGAAQLGFAMASVVAPLKLDGLRAVFMVADLVTLALFWVMLADTGRSPLLAGLYWLNPLIVWSGYGTVHSEILLAPLLLGFCLAAWRGRDVMAAALLALAVGIKLWPVLLVPLFARLMHSRGRSLVWPALVFSALCVLLLAPLAVSAINGARSGLVAYSEHWWTNNGPFSWISYWVYLATSGAPGGQRALRAALALSVGGLALWLARRPARDLGDLVTAAMIIAAATFYAAPAQFPWYALWFLPLAAAVRSLPLLLASATLPIYYFYLPLANQGIGHQHAYGWAFLHALPVWAWLVWERLVHRRAIRASR